MITNSVLGLLKPLLLGLFRVQGFGLRVQGYVEDHGTLRYSYPTIALLTKSHDPVTRGLG